MRTLRPIVNDQEMHEADEILIELKGKIRSLNYNDFGYDNKHEFGYQIAYADYMPTGGVGSPYDLILLVSDSPKIGLMIRGMNRKQQGLGSTVCFNQNPDTALGSLIELSSPAFVQRLALVHPTAQGIINLGGDSEELTFRGSKEQLEALARFSETLKRK